MNTGRQGPPVAREALSPSEALRPFRPGWIFSFFNALTWQVALGTPMVLMAEALGASSAVIGVMYAFVFLLTPVQIVSTSLLPKIGYKRMMLFGFGMRSLFLLPIIFLAWLAPEQGERWMVGVFVVSQFFFGFFRAMGSSAFLPWINAMLPERVRGRYFSTDQVASGIAGVGTLVFCAVSLAVLPPWRAFLLQYAVAFLGSWCSFAALARLPERGRPAALPLREVLSATPRLVLGAGDFRRFLGLGVGVGVAVSAVPPFCAYYLKVVPGLAPSSIVFFTTIQYVGVIAGAALIRSRVDRFGPKPFFRLAMALHALVAAAWLALLRGWGVTVDWLPAVYLVLGLAASCWFSATMKYLPQVVPQETRTLAFSVHAGTISLASGLAPILWGLAIKGHGVTPSVNVGAFQVFFLFVIVLLGGLLPVVARLPDREPVERGWFPGGFALRPFRAFTQFATLVMPGAGGRRESVDSDAEHGDADQHCHRDA